MEKKPAQKAKATPEYDAQRQQNVLLEQMSSDIKRVAEGHDSLKQDISQLRGTMEQRFDILEMAVTENSREIKAVKTDVKELKTDVKELKTDVKELKTDVKELKTDVEQLKSGQEEIKQKLDTVTTDHERRLQKLEAAP